MSLGLSIVALFAVPLSPFAGALIDRWGSRRLGIPGIALIAVAFAAFSCASGSHTVVRIVGGLCGRGDRDQDDRVDCSGLNSVSSESCAGVSCRAQRRGGLTNAHSAHRTMAH